MFFQIIDTMALHMPPEKLFQHIVSDHLHVHKNNVKCLRHVEFHFVHPSIFQLLFPCRVAEGAGVYPYYYLIFFFFFFQSI